MVEHQRNKEPQLAGLIAFLLGILLLVVPVLWALSQVVWLPDVLFKSVKVVGRHRIADGNQFEVVQTWNGDFYLMELVHTGPGGDHWRVPLDGDCPKVWRCKLSASEDLRLLQVSAKGVLGGLIGSYDWDRHELIRANGVVVCGLRVLRKAGHASR